MDVKENNIATEGGAAFEGERDKVAAKIKLGGFLKNTAYGALYAVCAYFLGGAVLPYGALPLGVAFLSVSDRRVFYIYAGLVLSALSSERRVLLIAVYSALILARLLTRLIIDTPWKNGEVSGERTLREIYPYIFSEHIAMRAALSAVGAFAIGLYRLIEGGMLYYDMYGIIVGAVSAPAAVLLVSGFFSERAKKYRRLVGFVALSLGVIYFIGDAKLYGISLAVFGCMAVTLYTAKKEGAATGTVTGALLGLTLGVWGAPLFAFAGLVSGLIFPLSVPLALFGSLSVGVAWGVYAQGLSILNGTLSALVSSTLIFGMIYKLCLPRETDTERADDAASVAALRAQLSEAREGRMSAEIQLVSLRLSAEETKSRLEGFSTGLSSISELLYNMSKNLSSPCYADIRQICDGAFESVCCSCEARECCWKENYRETTDALNALCATIQKEGQAHISDASVAFSDRCGRLSDILSQINHNVYLHARQLFENDRTELFAADFEAMSELVRSCIDGDGSEFICDELFTSELEMRLAGLGFDIDGACVFGREKKSVIIFCADAQGLLDREVELVEVITSLCGRVSSPAVDTASGFIRFTSAPSFSVAFAKRSSCAEGESEFCGDTAGYFESENGKSYAFISDGMGSGREAAMTSGLCGLFLRGLLSRGGSDAAGVLKLLNGFLRNRGGGSLHECSSTIDLMEIDPYGCRASFYKSGASPTYVFRNGSLFKIRSHTVPVGIIRELDFRRIDLELSEGDLVVMVSDGVTDGREECPWLFDLLRSQSSAEPQRLSELIVKYAKSEGATDDVTALVIKPTFL